MLGVDCSCRARAPAAAWVTPRDLDERASRLGDALADAPVGPGLAERESVTSDMP